MPVETAVFKKEVSANAVEEALKSIKEGEELIPKKGEKITVLEVSCTIAAAGYVHGYYGGTRFFEFDYRATPDHNHRVVTNLVLLEGEKLKFVGTDKSGAANWMAVLLVYERGPA